MKSENFKSDRSFEQLGLPPMELAESGNERSSRCLYRCIYPTLQKTLMMLIIITFSVGLYVLIFKLLNSTENTQNTEIILVTGRETHNITVHQNDWEIWFQLNNHSDTNIRRKRRDTFRGTQIKSEILERLKDDERVKEIIQKHNFLCHDEKHREVCAELISKLNFIINQNNANALTVKHIPKLANDKQAMKVKSDNIHVLPTEVLKRETNSLHKIRNILNPDPSQPLGDHGMLQPAHQHLSESCLLARLLKHQFPNAHEVYDPPISEPIHFDNSRLTQNNLRYFQPSVTPFTQSRANENNLQKLHPQDFNIFMSFFNKLENSPKEETKKSSRAMECPSGSLPCDNSEDCIEEGQWCDGNVDCADASDEIRCSCKSRVDKSRLCDGYFDCPLGEDEMGCFGCSASSFSCGNAQNSCFTKEQRCNNVNDCPNHRDEIECNMLSPNLDNKPLFAISNTEGYLHRNFKGDWYAVCQNPYMWAHDACRREAGLIIRPPVIQIFPIDPIMKINYMNTGPGGFMQTSDNCFNSSAVYVTCPDFLCGTRVQTSSQLLRESLENENHIFGRNKRFLFPSFDPYRMYYGNRMKREASAIQMDNEKLRDTKTTSVETRDEKLNISYDNRNKRAELRVVGGKPSQPAAWPWMVAIYRDGMFHCGGVIMTQSWIISAAHCLHKFWDYYYEVQVGMLRRFSFSPQEQNHRVAHVIVNHKYSQTDMRSDLSLLKVEPAIQFSRWVRPICLPGPNTAGPDWLWGPASGTVCTAVGWGATVEHGPDPDHLREVDLPIWEQCKHPEDREGQEICAGLVQGGKDACQGDSGGPLLCRNPLNSQQWFLAGIVSHGDGCARKDEPGVYTRVSLFVKWIKYHTSSKSLPRLRPKQECPGFKCLSGIPKCLPSTRKCDKIIDCLDAEDEKNCEFMRTSYDSTIKEVNTARTEKKSDKTSREVVAGTFSSKNTTDGLNQTVTVKSTTEHMIDTTTTFNVNINNAETYDMEESESVLTSTDKVIVVNDIPDFSHPSTSEVSFTKGSDEVDIDEGENVTDDPLNKENESNIFAVSFRPRTLESRSSVLESSKNSSVESTTKIKIDDVIVNEFTLTPLFKSQTHTIETLDPTTQISRGDMLPDEVITTESNSITEPNDKLQSSNVESKSQNVIIELLPQSTATQIDKTILEENIQKPSDDIVSEINDIKSSKILPDAEESNNLLQKVEDFVFTELQPANIRRKHRMPTEFECRRIYQLIPHNRRCDRKADCEDGTDELDCTCTDYLSAYNDKLICDGVYDCADGQDENDCYSCPEDYFLCKRSEICLPTRYVCDEKAQCPLGEDEMSCFALSNGKEMFYDIDEKPKVNLEGFLTRRKEDNWHVVCDDKLSIEQQEESAAHICRYLGFSSANRYFVKYVNVKNEDVVRTGLDALIRKKRGTLSSIPIQFTFTDVSPDNRTARNIVIKEPQVLKEECVPNVTKTCKSLYVFCDRALYTNFEVGQNIIYNRAVETDNEAKTALAWPWIAKLYVEGEYKCTGILIDLSWVLVSDSCLWDASPSRSFVTVILGSHRTLNAVNGWYEQIRKVDAKKDLYKSRVVLVHLNKPANYSNMVKPMIFSSPSYNTVENIFCVAIGQDYNNNTISVFLNETTKNCKLGNRCFVRNGNESICTDGAETNRNWSGLISCHSEQGWYPAASFVDSRGECGLGDHIIATDIENLRQEIKYYLGNEHLSSRKEETFNSLCQGVRCGRGKCVSLNQMCDGVRHCEDGNDESDTACMNKHFVCSKDPFLNGCECTTSQMKCKNGNCISKTLFRDGHDDCQDGTDEPVKTSCSDYLATVMPSKLCDGTLHCHDRSDENPYYCKCFAKEAYKCQSSKEDSYCVASDMVCDGVRDCPNGDDERSCIALSAPEGTPYGMGQVLVRSHGVWHAKCYPTQNHTMSELEAICRDLGFLSGHARQIKDDKYHINPHNNLILEPFRDVVLNNQTVIKMRNPNTPVVATAIFDADLKNCFPVVIECV